MFSADRSTTEERWSTTQAELGGGFGTNHRRQFLARLMLVSLLRCRKHTKKTGDPESLASIVPNHQSIGRPASEKCIGRRRRDADRRPSSGVWEEAWICLAELETERTPSGRRQVKVREREAESCPWVIHFQKQFYVFSNVSLYNSFFDSNNRKICIFLSSRAGCFLFNISITSSPPLFRDLKSCLPIFSSTLSPSSSSCCPILQGCSEGVRAS